MINKKYNQIFYALSLCVEIVNITVNLLNLI